MAGDIQERNEALLKVLHCVYSAADEAGQLGLANFIQDQIASTQKVDWQLRMICGKSQPADIDADDDDEEIYEAAMQPPNYREAEDPARSCGTCVYFDGEGRCEAFKVDAAPRMTCDEWGDESSL